MSRKDETSQPIYGNYHGYYSKRPSTKDSRLELIPSHLLQNASVLDIGCNEGWVTCQIAQSYDARKVVGVDIDDTLIRAAWKRRRAVWSKQQPHEIRDAYFSSTKPIEPQRKKRHVQDDCSAEAIVAPKLEADYFPSSCEHEHGPLPILPATSDITTFPHNVIFHTADWVDTKLPEDAEGYDVVIAFSVSKWIHLNTGDDGLQRFFQRVHEVLKPGGSFIFEPQEWDGYAKAKRMDPRLKESGNKLLLRPDKFEEILTEIGFCPPEHLGRPGEGGFHRPVDLYKKSV